jgi:hypothetical protein
MLTEANWEFSVRPLFLKTTVPDVLPCPNHTRHGWARWDAYIDTLDPDTLFDEPSGSWWETHHLSRLE